jgi:hypothetical protein
VGCFRNFQEFALSKQSPEGLKFAQSGHPASNRGTNLQNHSSFIGG